VHEASITHRLPAPTEVEAYLTLMRIVDSEAGKSVLRAKGDVLVYLAVGQPRRYFNRMPRTAYVALFLYPVAVLALLGRPATADERSPLKVCILSGCPTYNSETSLPPFQDWLETNYNVRCTRVVRQAVDNLPGLEQLDDCDVALVFFKRMELKGDQLERFKRYVTSGRPLVAVRTASHAVQTWLAFDREVLGGNYQMHYPKGPVTTVEIIADSKNHPILAGVEITQVGEPLYKNRGHAADVQVLLRGAIPGEPGEDVAWAREYKGGRIFYTSLGSEETFQQPGFRRMLTNALFWTTSRELQGRKP
jgi:type 1 glutamine amidotransferase